MPGEDSDAWQRSQNVIIFPDVGVAFGNPGEVRVPIPGRYRRMRRMWMTALDNTAPGAMPLATCDVCGLCTPRLPADGSSEDRNDIVIRCPLCLQAWHFGCGSKLLGKLATLPGPTFEEEVLQLWLDLDPAPDRSQELLFSRSTLCVRCRELLGL